MSPSTGEQQSGEPVCVTPSQYRVPTADELRRMRILAQKSQREVADAIGVDKDTVRRWEAGESEPPLSKIHALLEYFDDAGDGQSQLGRS